MIRTFLLLLCLATPAAADCVVLLHGLARGTGTWLRLEPILKRDGYTVVNQAYPSTEDSLADLAAAVVPEAIASCPSEGRINFVTHSMGGIILRHYAANSQIPRFGRAVMIAPPNKGSEIVDEFADLEAFGWINGPAGAELGTGADDLPRRLGPANFEVGVIAGTRSYNPVFSALISGTDDGKVSVESTKLDGMSDHVLVEAGHTFIAMNPDAMGHVQMFLKTGSFAH